MKAFVIEDLDEDIEQQVMSAQQVIDWAGELNMGQDVPKPDPKTVSNAIKILEEDFNIKITPIQDTARDYDKFIRLKGLQQTHVPKLGSQGSGWHKEPVSHSYASKFGKAPAKVRGR